MIRLDRVLGGVVLTFGVSLLVYLIPTFTSPQPDSLTDPSLFPRLAGWMFVFLGGLQIIFPGSMNMTVTVREVSRLTVLTLCLVVASVLMPLTGYLPASIALMVVVMLMIYERRPLWAVLSVACVPIGVWVLFEILLKQPLP
jgi:hypothetical protein